MKLFKGRYILGIIIILLGVSLLLENFGYQGIDIGYVIRLAFPILLILWGIDLLFRKQGLMSIIGGLLLSLLGVSILGHNMGWFDLDLSIIWRMFWPIILIFIGISIITSIRPGKKNNLALMGAVEKNKTHWELEDDTYTAIMGGVELDLRFADIPDGETNIKLTAIMGGIDIIVPHDITVYCKGNVILGGLEFFNQSTGGLVSSLQAEQLGNNKIIRFDSNTIMGGIEIKTGAGFKKN